MTTIGPIAFAAPWVLFGLVLIPVIWWLLRVTPPAPKKVQFPAVKLLLGLQQSEETPARTPLWLLLLRVAIASLVILSLADPFLNPEAAGTRTSAVVIVVDNSWAAAARWDDRVGAMQNLAAEAERDRRPLVVVPTASSDIAIRLRKMSGAEAQGAAKAISPQPYGVDRLKAISALKALGLEGQPDIIWLSDGLEDRNCADFATQLARLGKLRVLSDSAANTPLALTLPKIQGSALVFRVIRSNATSEMHAAIRATGAQGRYLASQDFVLKENEKQKDVSLELATELRNDLARVEISSHLSAGSTILADERWRRRPVGLVSGQTIDAAQPLLSDLFYLDRALQPYAELHQGRIVDLVKAGLSVLMLADVGQVVGEDRTAVSDWVSRGGILVRFSGPKLAAQSDELIPGKLRTGGRLLGSAMSWENPQTLGAWPDNSPFIGLPMADDVTIKRQILTDPSTGSDVRTWAQLADGTPLVTATPHGKGWIVLFHVTANTSWSSLPLSGLFVEMLRRTIATSAGMSDDNPAKKAANAPLPPIETLDGFGHLGSPSASALPVRSLDLETASPSPQHPPGFYGDGGERRAFNLFRFDDELHGLADLPAGIQTAEFGLRQASELKYPLMTWAVILGLLDLLVSLFLRGLISVNSFRSQRAIPLILLAFMVALSVPDARADDAFDMKAALNYRLAYIQTGDPEVDAMSRAGLLGLTRALKERTAVEPSEPIGVDIESDELAFFPLLYWPVSQHQPQLSAAALSKVDAFMRNGGTILFDTRDQNSALPSGSGSLERGSVTLRRLLAGLDIPPLQPLGQDHVLSRTFYLLHEYPGRWATGRVWVEGRQSTDTDGEATTASDGVSPIIVGGADWAAAWAEDAQGRPIAAVAPGGERQREMAFRFGINLVMYTLTGNYKADLVHVPSILERLGQ